MSVHRPMMMLATLVVLAALGVLAGGLVCAAAPALAGEGLGVTGMFGRPGSGPGELSLSTSGSENPGSGMAVNASGDIYVADTGNNRVEWFNAVGQYEGQFNGVEIDGTRAKTPAPAKLAGPESIAIDNNPSSESYGDIYVADNSEEVVDKFSPTGEFILQLPLEKVSNRTIEGLAVDPSGNVWIPRQDTVLNMQVWEFDNAGENKIVNSVIVDGRTEGLAVDSEDNLYTREFKVGLKHSETGAFVGTFCEECAGGGLAIETGTNDLLVNTETSVAQYGPFGEPFETPFRVSKPGIMTEGVGIAVDPVSHAVYAADAGSDQILSLAPGATPKETPETFAATDVKNRSAILHGKISPHSSPAKLEYYFEYNSGASCGSGSRTPVKEGEEGEEVAEEVAKLAPNAKYTFCLVTENNFGMSKPGLPVSFNTLVAPPEVLSESAFSVGKGEGSIAAAIDPDNEETTYFFEYSKEASGEVLTGEVEKTGEAYLPAEYGAKEVSASGLELRPVNETFYYRVVTRNGAGETKGKVQAYTAIPIITQLSFAKLTSTSVKLEASVNPTFENTAYAFEYATSEAALEGGTGIQPPGGTGELAGEEASGPVPLSVNVYSLQPGQTYYYRIVAENQSSKHKENANEGRPVTATGHFKAVAAPAVTTGAARAITQTTATLTGIVEPEGAAGSYYFEYIDEAGYRGALAKGAANPYAEGETTPPVGVPASYTAQAAGPTPASGLLPGQTYHYALVARNEFGAQGVGRDQTFTTAAATPPSVTTMGASAVTQSGATIAGTVTTNGLQTDYGFELGTEPGVYGAPTGLGSIGGELSETVSTTLVELQPATTYYYRVTATNADGTAQGEPETFTTPGFPSLLSAPLSPSQIAIPSTPFPTDVEESATPGTKTKAKSRPETGAQKFRAALRQCHRRPKKARAKCEKQARGKYG